MDVVSYPNDPGKILRGTYQDVVNFLVLEILE